MNSMTLNNIIHIYIEAIKENFKNYRDYVESNISQYGDELTRDCMSIVREYSTSYNVPYDRIFSMIVDGTKDEFITQQITDESYSYILAHALITFCMEKAPKDFFTQLISALRNKENSTNIKELIQTLYPGGFTQFKEDFTTNYQ